MDSNMIIFIVLTILVLGIVLYFVRSLIKAALITFLIVIIFRIGFIYSSDDVVSLLRLDRIMDPAKVEDFRIFYDDFKKKREQDPIIIPEELDKTVQEELKGKIDDYLNQPKEGDE